MSPISNRTGPQGAVYTHVIWSWSVCVYIVAFVCPVAGKVCVKRTELGSRHGNLYVCSDPRRSECCEREETFTCCEPEWEKILLNQIWLVSTLLAIFLALVMVYVCYSRQEELFESDTARQAALRLGFRAHRVYTSLWKRKEEDIDPEVADYEKFPIRRSIDLKPDDHRAHEKPI